MKAQELATIIANMAAMAASLGQLAQATRTVDGEKVVVLTASDLVNIADKLVAYCNELGELIPDLELEFDDASHRNDK